MLKISIGLFFLRITVERWQKSTIHCIMLVSTSFSIALFFFTIFQCGFFKDFLEFVVRKGTNQCASDTSLLAMAYTHAVITALTDWIFIILPFFILRKSSMPRREKWAVGALMSLASISGIASLVRFKYVNGLAVPQESFFQSATNIAIWSCIEPGVGIAAASIICLRPLFRKTTTPVSKQFYTMSNKSNRVGRRPSLSVLCEEDDWTRDPRDSCNDYDANPEAPSWPLPAAAVMNTVKTSEKEVDDEIRIIRHERRPSDGLPLAIVDSRDSMRPTSGV